LLTEMTWKIVFLGMLQGLLEWFPISSQGNLVLAMIHLLGIGREEALNISVNLHLGTMFASLAYFREDFLALAKVLPNYHLRHSNGVSNLITFLLFSSIISGFIGYFVFKIAEISLTIGEYFSGAIGFALVMTGLLHKYSTKHEIRETKDVKILDTLLLGIAQGFSAFPGISRSGITISALLYRKFKSEAAITLSFLMSVPAVLMAMFGLSITAGFVYIGIADLILGSLSSFITGLLAIHVFMKTAQKVDLSVFCMTIGVLALLPTFSYLLGTVNLRSY